MGKDKKEEDVEEQLKRIQDKEKSMYEEKGRKATKQVQIKKEIRQHEDQLNKELKKLSELQTKLEIKFAKIAETGIGFSENIKKEINILTSKLEASGEEFKEAFKRQYDIDLNAPPQLLMKSKQEESDMPMESTHVNK